MARPAGHAMLSVLLILSGLGQLTSAGRHSVTSLLQITVPQKIVKDTKDGRASDTNVTYAIKINRKTFTLHLEKQGLLQLENISYGIEPLESSATYEHMIYQIKDNKSDFPPIVKNHSTTQFPDQPFKILVKSEKKSDVLLKRILKIQVIIDKALYDYMGSEVALASEKVVYIFSLINNMFSQLKMTIMLTSLELWSDKNKILTNGDANEMLQKFVSWKEKKLFQRSHDMAYLLIYRDHPNYIGATYHGMACNPKFAAGIALYPKMISLEAFSVILAQLIGINLGLTYKSDIYNCDCPGNICIMNPEAIRSRGVKFFSSCSIDEFKSTVSQPEFECLQNQIISKVVSQGQVASCGNGVLDAGEQCDCGDAERCSHKKCCNPKTCELIANAECGTGICCDKETCQIAERGTLCRRSTDVCDFPEYCNGITEFCVPDVKSADLETCNNKTAFCFQGLCRDPDKQCAELFGKFARGGSDLCSQHVNGQTDNFGNCRGRFCRYRDLGCGKIVCTWMRSEVVPFKNFDTQYTYYKGLLCVSAQLRNSTPVNLPEDFTYTWDGTMCGPKQFCMRGSCTNISDYVQRPNCNSTARCRGHGVCNTQLNCHCDAGYAPPACEPSPSSPGGSIDDGFWILED